jgi:hypothetical protein
MLLPPLAVCSTTAQDQQQQRHQGQGGLEVVVVSAGLAAVHMVVGVAMGVQQAQGHLAAPHLLHLHRYLLR